MTLRVVAWALGQVLRPYAFLLVVPALLDLALGHGFRPGFLVTAAASFAVGTLMVRSFRSRPEDVGRVEALAIVALSWLLAAALGSVPYLNQGFRPVDAFFESMSGFTTTGATIFTDEWSRFVGGEWTGPLTPGLIFWRALTQWLGGLGIIVLFVAVLPALAVAGRRMFFAEAPGPEEEALTPRIRHTAAALWRLYIGLTILEAALLATAGGMNAFDAVCHAFTTLAAGGFSPHPESLAGYGAAAQWIVIPFMFLAGASFSLQYRALLRPSRMARDPEFRLYALLFVFVGLGLAALIAPGFLFGDGLRHGLFQAISILTTTGYASDDFNLWSQGSLMLLGALMFIGGCAGSAGGGPKVVRVLLLARFLGREVLKALHPRVVRAVKLGRRSVPDDTMRQILGFLLAYSTIFGFSAVLTGMIENDMLVGFTGSIVTLGNIGPGYGEVGPMGTFGDLTDATKLIFCFNMWVGRLEVMTVLLLFHPDVLRSLFQGR